VSRAWTERRRFFHQLDVIPRQRGHNIPHVAVQPPQTLRPAPLAELGLSLQARKLRPR
jgi:hypothetical protein